MPTVNDLRELKVEELHNHVAELKQTLFEMKTKHRTGALDSTVEIRNNRREVARCLTVAREAELGLKRTAKAPAAGKPAKKGKE